jgi:hypothetical protein
MPPRLPPDHRLYRLLIAAEMALEARWWMGWWLWERSWMPLFRWLDGVEEGP